jgi:hypothetical protein
MSDEQSPAKPDGDEDITTVPRLVDPGVKDGVGEHAVEGLGHDGVRRMDGEFGDLDDDIEGSG